MSPSARAEHAQAVIDIGDAHEFPVWAAVGSCLHGAAIAATGAVDDGLARFEAAIDQYRALKSPPVFWPSLLQLHAARARPGRTARRGHRPRRRGARDRGGTARTADAVVGAVVAQGQLAARACSNDARRGRGRGSSGPSGPPTSSRRRCSSCERRRPSRGSGTRRDEPASARVLLSTAYDRLTEGFTTADLTDADSCSTRSPRVTALHRTPVGRDPADLRSAPRSMRGSARTSRSRLRDGTRRSNAGDLPPVGHHDGQAGRGPGDVAIAEGGLRRPRGVITRRRAGLRSARPPGTPRCRRSCATRRRAA